MNSAGRDEKQAGSLSARESESEGDASDVHPLLPSTVRYPAGFEEVDELRSSFIRELTLEQLAHDPKKSTADSGGRTESIPRTLVQYWDDPVAVPADVNECLKSWNVMRLEGVAVKIFGDASARDFIAERYGPSEVAAFERCRHPAMRSDFFRMGYLLAEGGLYVDADDVLVGAGWRTIFDGSRLKVQPFCYDVEVGGMVSALELRKADLPTENRIFYVNNNPIAAPPGHPVLRRALTRATRRLLQADTTPEIQSTTGPGNLTASLAAHARDLQERGVGPDFELLVDWAETAHTRWDLAYRSGSRNWRNMDQR